MIELNDIGFLIYNSSNKVDSYEEICEKVCSETGDNKKEALPIIKEFVDDLSIDGFIEKDVR